MSPRSSIINISQRLRSRSQKVQKGDRVVDVSYALHRVPSFYSSSVRLTVLMLLSIPMINTVLHSFTRDRLLRNCRQLFSL